MPEDSEAGSIGDLVRDHRDAVLFGRLDDLAATPLDRRKPLWRATVVTGYRGGTAIIWNMHHAVGDGIAGMALLGAGMAVGRVLRMFRNISLVHLVDDAPPILQMVRDLFRFKKRPVTSTTFR